MGKVFSVHPVFDPQTEANERRLFHIKTHLEVFVPIAISEIKHQDGPTELQQDRARGFLGTSNTSESYYAPFEKNTNPLTLKGDSFLYGGKEGEASTYMGQLTWALAVMAFQPGGVTLFGLHFEEQIRQSEVDNG